MILVVSQTSGTVLRKAATVSLGGVFPPTCREPIKARIFLVCSVSFHILLVAKIVIDDRDLAGMHQAAMHLNS